MKKRKTTKKARRDPALDKKALWRSIEKDQRAAYRKKLALLQARISDARKRGPAARERARSFCRIEREKALARARAIRRRMAIEAHALAEAQKDSARWACAAKRQAHRVKISALRSELENERRHHNEIRRIEVANRRGMSRPGPFKARARERQSESDDEVRSNIPSDLIPLWNRVRRGIKASSRMTRTEAFMKYAEEHPREQYAGIEDKTDALVRDLERQQRAGRRDLRPRRRKRGRC